MNALAPHLIWALVALLAITGAFVTANRYIELAMYEADSPQSEASLVVPDDLAALALGETEKWAQDSVMSAIRERWEQYHDWNKVRAALGVARKDGE